MNEIIFLFQAILVYVRSSVFFVTYNIILIFLTWKYIASNNLEWLKIKYEKSDSGETVRCVRIPSK